MRRLVNRLLALVLSLALIAAAGLLLVEAVAALLGRSPVLVDWPAAAGWARRRTWDNPQVLAVSLLLAVVGLALVLGQLWPSRTGRLPVNGTDPATDAAVTRRTLARDIATAVGDVDGVVPRRVDVGRSRIAVRASVPPTGDRSVLAEQVKAAVAARLDRLQLRRPPRLAVKVSRRTR
ncbi:hypothetical protein CS0771_64310 [Catellatospora sp. IY07-71]|uniref:DUF6286 domain-containing protein n=1 Tax=Catellatospora sp. IY07-71 TaxID=2728827 RepID=UPI001BB32A76|nr:DUF6286 domain-containing protein [Catellatospora sp. IY07-71]BCJ76887.1 hypothetical protein CS0771_64310 [Catellatospora sp. IY07-71]